MKNSVQEKHYNTIEYGYIVLVKLFTDDNGIDMVEIVFSSGKLVKTEWIAFAFYAVGLTVNTIWIDIRKK